MRVVVQRVKRASVTVDHGCGDGTTAERSEVVSEIGKGILCLVGVKEGDEGAHAEWICKQIVSAKLFEGMSEANADKRWRSNVKQNGFEILLVSQFTLNGRVCSKGKVDFTGSMPPAKAKEFYGRFVDMVKGAHSPELVKDGVFGAKMDVSLVNDGPITVVVDSSEMNRVTSAPSSEARQQSGDRDNTGGASLSKGIPREREARRRRGEEKRGATGPS
ncbi:unnamed protein product [Scytosiphon promiscuus]